MLFEGAQGALLDIDHGTYPYVTSSQHHRRRRAGRHRRRRGRHRLRARHHQGLRTRVGGGPFPTELDDDIGRAPAQARRRIRRHAPAARAAAAGSTSSRSSARSQINGITGLCITKLDVLDGMDELKVCIAYEYRGKRTELRAAGRRRLGRVHAGVPGIPRLGGIHRRHHATGTSCRPPRAPTCARSRNSPAAASRSSPPAPIATTTSCCAIRSPDHLPAALRKKPRLAGLFRVLPPLPRMQALAGAGETLGR